jgi:hypothetical protein
MKRLTCRDLGGPCDAKFAADSFEEIGKKSQEHVMEQMQKGDAAHLSAASSMRSATPEQQIRSCGKASAPFCFFADVSDHATGISRKESALQRLRPRGDWGSDRPGHRDARD